MPNKKKKEILLLFIIPALVFYLIFWIAPVLMSFFYGLTDWNGLGDANYVGFDNFKFLFKDGTLSNAMKNTVVYALVVVIWGNVQALALALLLNMKLKARGAFRTIFYIPALFSTIVVAFIWSYVYAPYYGMLYEVLGKIGIGQNLNLLGSTGTALIAVAFVETWKTSGTMTIIYLAGLQSIPEEVMESARIDGCTAWQSTAKVKIPMLANTITINVMLGLINGFKSFDYVFALTGGGPGTSSGTLMYTIYKMAFMEGQFGKAEALAAFAFIFILLISVIALTIMKRKEIEA
ncbi:carbohydrate ABC transporter permease [Clostridium sp. C105KSO13]|uniref:carbohydrate ABC transporter permease n=1 Tax=Clostridium sp. C105KSO13 TaxID=1776045 RepID=UPI00074066EF|nr:sugar ABC transporter permease [Clostridium sp. C105KSO13]CUX17400.1 sn-glycerol-3-phosphate transport system permease protein UgpA [Clostridium sp. C105KSO13]